MSLLDLLGITRIYKDGVEALTRKGVNFTGAVTITDDPVNQRTNIALTAEDVDLSDYPTNAELAAAITAALAPRLPRVYTGHCTGSLTHNATSWTGFIASIGGTYTDVVQDGITRAASTFTFAEAGYYRAHANFLAYGQDAFVGFRLRSGGVTLLQRTTYGSLASARGVEAGLDGIVSLTAGQAVTLEYVTKTGTFAASPADPLDGESMRFGRVSFERV